MTFLSLNMIIVMFLLMKNAIAVGCYYAEQHQFLTLSIYWVETRNQFMSNYIV